MAQNSVFEIIGGVDGGGGIPVANDDNRAGLAGGGSADDLWLENLELGNTIFGLVAISKVGFVSFMWFFYYLAGTRIKGMYYWTWFSALLAVYIAWGPVAVSYALMSSGLNFAKSWFFYSALASISGPLVGYFIPLVLLILAYQDRADTGLIYSSKIHFWLGWILGILITILSILFEVAFLPGIRIWYDQLQEFVIPTTDSEPSENQQTVDEPQGNDDIPQENTQETIFDTTFLAVVTV